MTAESVGALVWFLIPRFRAGEFGGAFTIEVGEVPPPDSGPVDYPDGRFWLVNLSQQGANDPRILPGYVTAPCVIALYQVCVHPGCTYKGVPTNNRDECPCHGSKYLLNGVRIDGPARCDLDRFVIRTVDATGSVLAETKAGNPDADRTAGLPIALPLGIAVIVVDTAKRVTGERNPK